MESVRSCGCIYAATRPTMTSNEENLDLCPRGLTDKLWCCVSKWVYLTWKTKRIMGNHGATDRIRKRVYCCTMFTDGPLTKIRFFLIKANWAALSSCGHPSDLLCSCDYMFFWFHLYLYNYENNQQDALCRIIYYSKSALHVSGDIFAHHQEHLTVFTVSGSIQPSCCRLQPAATWLNTTRNCKYSQVLLMMGENIARNM